MIRGFKIVDFMLSGGILVSCDLESFAGTKLSVKKDWNSDELYLEIMVSKPLPELKNNIISLFMDVASGKVEFCCLPLDDRIAMLEYQSYHSASEIYEMLYCCPSISCGDAFTKSLLGVLSGEGSPRVHPGWQVELDTTSFESLLVNADEVHSKTVLANASMRKINRKTIEEFVPNLQSAVRQ